MSSTEQVFGRAWAYGGGARKSASEFWRDYSKKLTHEERLNQVRMIARMLTGDVSVKNISGPINIAQFAGYSASSGLGPFLGFLAIVSVSLAILNLLPVPMLDGGQILYQLAEAVKGSPLSEKAQVIGQQVGIAFLLILMSLAFYNDLSRLFR